MGVEVCVKGGKGGDNEKKVKDQWIKTIIFSFSFTLPISVSNSL